jgi:hypothetical protein
MGEYFTRPISDSSTLYIVLCILSLSADQGDRSNMARTTTIYKGRLAPTYKQRLVQNVFLPTKSTLPDLKASRAARTVFHARKSAGNDERTPIMVD